MSQLDELSSDTALGNDARAANMARHGDQSTLPNSPTSQEVRL
ncbi:hypothetical protein B0G76_3815 [Paraburkholderia sp. BL23I1N1]|nr:hypothetical protein [Paraburkholderia sp. BL23I1N1]RKE37555.1 hypothetical protein B0G76_3815 [Paraburkholderia sp. BL23I1N1]